mmetsp:Transcript_27066/g.47811  ORF Transcript_27066/g.47811 Transcript_27066/m.47811 type:complete len:242 (-) Transcript_27066:1196-1921(-)
MHAGVVRIHGMARLRFLIRTLGLDRKDRLEVAEYRYEFVPPPLNQGVLRIKIGSLDQLCFSSLNPSIHSRQPANPTYSHDITETMQWNKAEDRSLGSYSKDIRMGGDSPRRIRTAHQQRSENLCTSQNHLDLRLDCLFRREIATCREPHVYSQTKIAVSESFWMDGHKDPNIALRALWLSVPLGKDNRQDDRLSPQRADNLHLSQGRKETRLFRQQRLDSEEVMQDDLRLRNPNQCYSNQR